MRMEKRSRKKEIFRIALITTSIPIVIISLLVTLIYIPPVQRYIVDKVCEEINEVSGYHIEIGSLELTFPLKLRATDFKVSKNENTYLHGERLDADISILPLLTGNLEINHISLENVDVHTNDLLISNKIDGKIGYARMAVRDVDFSRSIANIKQLHIQESYINIIQPDTITEKEIEDDKVSRWIINLRNGDIRDCHVTFSSPGDSINSALDIEKLQIRGGYVNIAEESYAVEEITLNCSKLNYDIGSGTQEEAPLKHIGLENVSLDAGNLFYAENNIRASINKLNLEQPGGLSITNATAHLTSENDTLLLKGININSQNGSYIHGEFIIPRQTLFIPINKEFRAGLSASIRKRDLVKLITTQMYDNLAIFNEEMLNARIAISGNIHNIKLDTIDLQFPGIGAINANGSVKNIIKAEKANGNITFNGNIENIAGVVTPSNNKPCSLSLMGNVCFQNKNINATLTTTGEMGRIGLVASYDIVNTKYDADLKIEQLSLGEIAPDIPLHNLTMNIEAKGKGFDIFHDSTSYEIKSSIDTLDYADYKFRALSAEARQENCISSIIIEGCDNSLLFNMLSTTQFNAGMLDNNTTIKLERANFKTLGMTDAELSASTQLDIVATSDLATTHTLGLTSRNTSITTNQYGFTPEDLQLEFTTSPKCTELKLKNGDLNANGRMESGYTTLLVAIDTITEMYNNFIGGNRNYNLQDFERVLPQMNMHVECGKNNVLHNYLAFNGIETQSLNLDLTVSPSKGLDIKGDVYKFKSGDIELNDFKITTTQNGDILDYEVGIENLSIASFEEKNSYSASMTGTLSNYTATADLRLNDNIRELSNRIGAIAHFTPQKMSISFDREALLFGEPFVFNDSNYINIYNKMKIEADVLFKNSEEIGFHLYTIPKTRTKYNVFLDVFNVDLGQITNSIPGIPSIDGKLHANINYQGRRNSDSVVCDIKTDNLSYEGNKIGNESVKLSYMATANKNSNIDIAFSHDNAEVAHINCDIDTTITSFSNGKLSLKQFPLTIANAFTNETGVIANGYVNGDMEVTGTFDSLLTQGYINFDSVYVYIPTLGTTLHPAEDNIMIEKSRINFNRFHIYDKVNTPFIMNGTVDIANPTDPIFNLRLNASNYEVINTPRATGKSIYGKLFIDLRSFIRGTLNNLSMTGDIAILSNSNIAYVLPETAFSTEKDLDGLVEFVNFSDTTSIVYEKQPEVDLGNIAASFNISIKEGAKIGLDLDAAHENYIIFEGDGTLNATYNQNGFNVTGIYKLNSGDLKLTLPIIPLKTFHIQEGGRITWTGDLFNPTLDITALEKTTVSVEFDDNSIQPTTFYTGVVLSNTVENMGIDFTMSSPDNMIQEQLNQLDKETLSKYAVAMIITGTYLGGRQGVTATSALSSFLDAKINDLSGEAIKNFDVNIGINDGLDAQTGNSYKNYSFSFSKRFFNDRITVVVGGEVNSGDRPDKDASNSSIINNVSLEWKLNDSGNRYMRIFYDKNYRSILEGEITETGIGYVYKRKLNKLKDLFHFKKNKTKKKRAGETKINESKR